MNSRGKCAKKSTTKTLLSSRSIWSLIFSLIISTLIIACANQSQSTAVPTPNPADQAEGQSQAVTETETKLVNVATSTARGYSEREDFVGTFIGQWLVENQPAREVLLALRPDDTAQMAIQAINDPSNATDDSGTWVFEHAGVATITLEESGQLVLRFDEGLFLSGGEFGAKGIPMLLYNPQ